MLYIHAQLISSLHVLKLTLINNIKHAKNYTPVREVAQAPMACQVIIDQMMSVGQEAVIPGSNEDATRPTIPTTKPATR